MLARLNILMALASLLPPPTGCDLLLSTVFLINSVKFNPAQYERILSQSFGPATLLSVQSETPTGAEVRNLYFPDHTEVRLFQLVHITRVQAAIVTANETNTTYHLSRRLSEFCRDAIAPVVIVSSGGGGGSTAFDFLSQIPPLVAPVAIGVWLSTVPPSQTGKHRHWAPFVLIPTLMRAYPHPSSYSAPAAQRSTRNPLLLHHPPALLYRSQQ